MFVELNIIKEWKDSIDEIQVSALKFQESSNNNWESHFPFKSISLQNWKVAWKSNKSWNPPDLFYFFHFPISLDLLNKAFENRFFFSLFMFQFSYKK